MNALGNSPASTLFTPVATGSLNSGISRVTGYYNSAVSFLTPYNLLIGLTLVFFVAMVWYWSTIGYSVKLGWESLMQRLGQKDAIGMGYDKDGDGAPDMGLTLTPEVPLTKKERNASAAPGMPGVTEDSTADVISDQIDKLLPPRNEVFNVSRNIYTFGDASPLCRAMGAELATYEQVQEAHKHGADWCNYGWTKGQMAVFPTQNATYKRLQEGPAEFRSSCGKPGVNGGHFDNPDLRFGVNCFGIRPEKKATDEMLIGSAALPLTPSEIEFDKRVQKFRDQLDTVTVLPWSRAKWST